MTTLSINLWKLSCCFERSTIFFIMRFTFRFQVFRVEGECGVRRGESLGEEGLAQLASAVRPSVWEFPNSIPSCDLKSFFHLLSFPFSFP